jgi:hypothetical protein
MSCFFKAVIYKVGVNPVVEVPDPISSQWTPVKGYIAVKGKINQYYVQQTLCPVKNRLYRL